MDRVAFEGAWAEISIVTAACTAQDLHRLAGDAGEKIRGSATTATPVLVSVAGHCRGGFEVLATLGWVARGRIEVCQERAGTYSACPLVVMARAWSRFNDSR
jgi:hypothetical protein